MWFVALQSFIDIAVAWRLGYLLPPWAPCFQRPDGLPSDAGPRSLARSGSSSHELYVHFKVRSLRLPARRRAPSTFQGFFPLRDFSEANPPSGELPSSPSFRPQRFSRSRRFTPRLTLRACFIPLPRPGFTLQGVSPPPSRPALRQANSLLPFAECPLMKSCPLISKDRRRASRVLIQVAIRDCRRGVYSRQLLDPLLSFQPSRDSLQTP